ncbi:MAG: family 16 glycoside hydrolase [Pirellulaceae bacterium]
MSTKPTQDSRIAVVLVLIFASLLATNRLVGQEVIVKDLFQSANAWEPTDANAWKIKKVGQGPLAVHVYSQFKKKSKYQPPHRSPLNISWLKEVKVSRFQLDVEVLSTHKDYPHRDACLFFGFQDPAHFYYVHMGKKTDDHANQIFIVNGKPRTKISTKTTPGTNWDDKWHRVRIIRQPADGTIQVYFDDMKTPIMTASDKTFASGRVGLGSFDDTTDWRNFKLQGTR